MKRLLLALGVVGWVAAAQPNDRRELGRLANGATVTFVRGAEGDWGLSVDGATTVGFRQEKPARIAMVTNLDNHS